MSSPLPTPTILAADRVRMVRAARIADETIPLAGGVACRRRAGAWPNLAAGFSLDPPISAADIQRLIAWLGEIGKPARVELNDRTEAAAFAAFADAGFQLKGLVSVLALRLDATRSAAATPPGIRIERIDPANVVVVRQLAAVLAEQFAAPGTRSDPDDIDANAAGISHPETIAFGAYDADQCIGGGFLDTLDDAATLWGAAVAPEYRNRGVQSALITHRLTLARERGATIAFIETSSGGPTHRNAARMGFHLAYSRAMLFRPLS